MNKQNYDGRKMNSNDNVYCRFITNEKLKVHALVITSSYKSSDIILSNVKWRGVLYVLYFLAYFYFYTAWSKMVMNRKGARIWPHCEDSFLRMCRVLPMCIPPYLRCQYFCRGYGFCFWYEIAECI